MPSTKTSSRHQTSETPEQRDWTIKCVGDLTEGMLGQKETRRKLSDSARINLQKSEYRKAGGGAGSDGEFLAARFRDASDFTRNVPWRIMAKRRRQGKWKSQRKMQIYAHCYTYIDTSRARGAARVSEWARESCRGENTVYRRTWSHMRLDLSYKSGRKGQTPVSTILLTAALALYWARHFVNTFFYGFSVIC